MFLHVLLSQRNHQRLRVTAADILVSDLSGLFQQDCALIDFVFNIQLDDFLPPRPLATGRTKVLLQISLCLRCLNYYFTFFSRLSHYIEHNYPYSVNLCSTHQHILFTESVHSSFEQIHFERLNALNVKWHLTTCLYIESLPHYFNGPYYFSYGYTWKCWVLRICTGSKLVPGLTQAAQYLLPGTGPSCRVTPTLLCQRLGQMRWETTGREM